MDIGEPQPAIWVEPITRPATKPVPVEKPTPKEVPATPQREKVPA